ncbi:hypothetical protein TrST_g8160 [Triparma strigata]|uniref:CRAL-TRIO domain-containing protein n=1 Tax=Triparma strigata TaxID=1606541 RepID=A0A9W7AV23_9STRA|nr:hypothetical protein TrST_g8160 [Triparma strigata]
MTWRKFLFALLIVGSVFFSSGEVSSSVNPDGRRYRPYLKKLSSSAMQAVSSKNAKIGLSIASVTLLKKAISSASRRSSVPSLDDVSSLTVSPALETFHLLLAKKLIATSSSQTLFSVRLLDLSDPATISLLNSFLRRAPEPEDAVEAVLRCIEYREEQRFYDVGGDELTTGPQFYDVEGRSIMHLHIATLAKEDIESIDSFVTTRLHEFDRTMQNLEWPRTNQIITIQDFTGLKSFKLPKLLKQAISAATKTKLKYYPEVTHKSILYNVPAWVGLLYKSFKLLLPASVTKKIVIIGASDGSVRELLEVVAPEGEGDLSGIPTEVGGVGKIKAEKGGEIFNVVGRWKSMKKGERISVVLEAGEEGRKKKKGKLPKLPKFFSPYVGRFVVDGNVRYWVRYCEPPLEEVIEMKAGEVGNSGSARFLSGVGRMKVEVEALEDGVVQLAGAVERA